MKEKVYVKEITFITLQSGTFRLRIIIRKCRQSIIISTDLGVGMCFG